MFSIISEHVLTTVVMLLLAVATVWLLICVSVRTAYCNIIRHTISNIMLLSLVHGPIVVLLLIPNWLSLVSIIEAHAFVVFLVRGVLILMVLTVVVASSIGVAWVLHIEVVIRMVHGVIIVVVIIPLPLLLVLPALFLLLVLLSPASMIAIVHELLF